MTLLGHFQLIYIIKQFKKCPYKNCDKKYGSDISLNLHIRIKHNGGSKIERENIAVIIIINNDLKVRYSDRSGKRRTATTNQI